MKVFEAERSTICIALKIPGYEKLFIFIYHRFSPKIPYIYQKETPEMHQGTPLLL